MSKENDEKKTQALDITTLDTYDLLGFFISILSDQAWQHLGLRVKAGTDKIERDLERARVAIDCTSFLIDKLEPRLEERERDAMRRLLADLQINFARLSSEKTQGT